MLHWKFCLCFVISLILNLIPIVALTTDWNGTMRFVYRMAESTSNQVSALKFAYFCGLVVLAHVYVNTTAYVVHTLFTKRSKDVL